MHGAKSIAQAGAERKQADVEKTIWRFARGLRRRCECANHSPENRCADTLVKEYYKYIPKVPGRSTGANEPRGLVTQIPVSGILVDVIGS